ncbi:MAG: hypothetical protein HYV34_03020 [Candidatus Kerfeldbacteria bacterium]|nr:hypothetical protein [Candidatus Kerfeldbacteria bacterium]
MTRIREYSIVGCGYVALAIFFTYPLIRHLQTHIIHGAVNFGRGDAGSFLWWPWWLKKAIFELGVWPTTTDYLYYPDGVNLMHGIENLTNSILGVLLSFFLNPVTGYNVLILFSIAASASAAYLFLRFLLGTQTSRSAAFLGGIIYGMSPYLLARTQGHLNLYDRRMAASLFSFLLQSH